VILPIIRSTFSRLVGGVGAAALAVALGVAAPAAGAASGHPGPHLLAARSARHVAAAAGGLINHGGPVQSAPKVYLDYWGWQSDPSGEQAYLNSFLASVGGTGWLATVNQYGGGSLPNLLAGTWSDPSAVPPSPTDAQIQAEADNAANHFGTGTSVNVQIVVATPTGHSTSGFGSQWCAYHGAVGALPNVTYTNLPYMTDAGGSCGANSVGGLLDGVSIVEGHELAETITDPQLNAWFDSGGSEIGDLCAWQNLSHVQTFNGSFAVQPLYSNAAGGCVSASDTGTMVSGLSSGLCVDDNGLSTADGTSVQIWGCNGGSNQQWTLNTNGTLTDYGKCMDINGLGTSDGTKVQLWTCNGGWNQVWERGPNNSVVNPYTGKCLDDNASSQNYGTQLQIWTCNGGSNQSWTLP
jgi:serine protease